METPTDNVHRRLVQGGHAGLFIGTESFKEVWVQSAAWIGRSEASDA